MTPDPRCTCAKLNELMPVWDVRSAHSIEIAASAQAIESAIADMDFSDSKIIDFLFTLRRFGRRKPKATIKTSLHESMQRAGFIEIARVKRAEIVIGVAGRFWRLDSGIDHCSFTAGSFQQYQRHGYVKAAWNFSITALASNKSLLCTQTRILSFGTPAKIKFRLYWMFVGYFSGMIRHEILHMVKRRAESVSSGVSA